jgi:hypothetical protein
MRLAHGNLDLQELPKEMDVGISAHCITGTKDNSLLTQESWILLSWVKDASHEAQMYISVFCYKCASGEAYLSCLRPIKLSWVKWELSSVPAIQCSNLLKNLISSRICSRELGQHTLVEQPMLRGGSDLSAICNENIGTLLSLTCHIAKDNYFCCCLWEGVTCTFCPHLTLASLCVYLLLHWLSSVSAVKSLEIRIFTEFFFLFSSIFWPFC